MRSIILLLAVFISYLSSAQPHKSASDLRVSDMDSSHLAVYLVATLEMIRPGDEELERLLSQKTVTKQDAQGLLKKASSKSSYQDGRALLTHYNITIDFFRKGSIYGNLTLSSQTGNITINDFENEKQAFGNVSKKFGDNIIQLLDGYKVLDLIDPSQLEGLTKDIH